MTTPATPVTPITESVPLLSDAPNRATDLESVYDDKADQFASEWVGIPPSQNTLSGQVNAIAAETNLNAAASFTNATESAASAATAQSAANFVGNYSAQSGAKSVPFSVFHNSTYWQLLVNVADVTATIPSSTNSDWGVIPGGLTWSNPKTASETLTPYVPNQFDVTGGDITATLPATLNPGDPYIINCYDSVNPTSSTNKVIVARNSNVIRKATGAVLDASGDGNLDVEIGETITLVVQSTGNIRAVGK